MLFQQVVHKVYVLKDLKINLETSETECIFHRVAGLQPAVSLKKTLRLSCFPMDFRKCFFVSY